MRGDKFPSTISTNHYNKLLSIGTERHMGRSLQYSAIHKCRDSACRRNLGTCVWHNHRTSLAYKSGAKPHFQKNHLPPETKNFPQEHPPKTKRINSSFCKGGCSWGKFSEREGGLEGESPLLKDGALSLQGLSLLPPRSSSSLTYHFTSRAGGESVEKKRAAGRETNAQTRVTAFPNPPRHPPERRRA